MKLGTIRSAIAAGRLAEFLRAPGLVFEQPSIPFESRFQPVSWMIRLLPPAPGVQLPADLSVSVTLTSEESAPTRYTAANQGHGVFKAKVIPVPRDSAKPIGLEVFVQTGNAVHVAVKDFEIRVGKQSLMLSEAEQILLTNSPPQVFTHGLGLIVGPIQGLGKVRDETSHRSIDLRKVQMINIIRSQPANQSPKADVQVIDALIEVKHETTIVARARRRIAISAEPPILDFREAGFIRIEPRLNQGSQQMINDANVDRGLLKIGGLLDVSGVPRGASSEIRPPDGDLGRARAGWESLPAGGVRQTECPFSHVYTTAFSQDGRLYASGGDDSIVRILDVESGQEIQKFKNDSWVQGLSFVRDGRKLIVGLRHRRAALWDRATGTVSNPIADQDFADVAIGASLLPDDRRILTIYEDGRVRLWDFVTGKELMSIANAALPGSRSHKMGTACSSPLPRIRI